MGKDKLIGEGERKGQREEVGRGALGHFRPISSSDALAPFQLSKYSIYLKKLHLEALKTSKKSTEDGRSFLTHFPKNPL